MAIVQTLHVEAGATYDSIEFQYLEDDQVTPVDLTDWSATLQVREIESGDLVLETTPEIGATSVVPAHFTGAQTSLFSGKSLRYGIELRHPSGEPVIQLARGKIVVVSEEVY